MDPQDKPGTLGVRSPRRCGVPAFTDDSALWQLQLEVLSLNMPWHKSTARETIFCLAKKVSRAGCLQMVGCAHLGYFPKHFFRLGLCSPHSGGAGQAQRAFWVEAAAHPGITVCDGDVAKQLSISSRQCKTNMAQEWHLVVAAPWTRTYAIESCMVLSVFRGRLCRVLD